MVQERQAGQDYFRTLLRTVVGQAFAAAGYNFQETPLQWAGGKYRFLKTMDDGFFGIIDFQVLVYSDTMWSAGAPSRFRVQVTRATERDGKARGSDGYATRGLSQLVVTDFGVDILPAADHWWDLQRYGFSRRGIGGSRAFDRGIRHALAGGRVDAAGRLA